MLGIDALLNRVSETAEKWPVYYYCEWLYGVCIEMNMELIYFCACDKRKSWKLESLSAVARFSRYRLNIFRGKLGYSYRGMIFRLRLLDGMMVFRFLQRRH